VTSAGFEPAILAIERLQFYALDGTATGIACYTHPTMYMVSMISLFGTICSISSAVTQSSIPICKVTGRSSPYKGAVNDRMKRLQKAN
jgi:hypothetical protein